MAYICFASVAIVTAVAFALRFVLRKLTSHTHLILHFDEYVGTLVSSVFIMELGIMTSVYGIESKWYCLSFLIHLILKHIYFMHGKLYGTPLSFFDLFYINNRKRDFTVSEIITIMATQVAACLSGQAVAKYIWAYGDLTHTSALQEVCLTSMAASFPWYYGVLLEAVGVFVCSVVDFFTPYYFKPLIRSLVTLVVFFYISHVSGLWMNPILASSFTFRCKGHQSDWQHFMIYWVGPALGLLLAWELRLLFDAVTSSIKNKSSMKKKDE